MLFDVLVRNLFQNDEDVFEKAFYDKLGKSPTDFIFTKLSVGSDKEAVEYLYDITAAEIASQRHCSAKPFSYFYPEAEKRLREYIKKKESLDNKICGQGNVHRNIKICQREFLNRKDTRPFGAQCMVEMDLLYSDSVFCSRIAQIGKENNQIEFCEDPQSLEYLKFKRNILPKRMDELGLTRHPIVLSLCEYVESIGKSRKSALITIYYAVRMYLLKRSIQ